MNLTDHTSMCDAGADQGKFYCGGLLTLHVVREKILQINTVKSIPFIVRVR